MRHIGLVGGYLAINKSTIENFSFIEPTEKIESKIANLAKSIQEHVVENCIEEQEKIDILVYKLYDLTYDEVKTIDNEFTMSEVEYNSYQI